MRKTFNSALCIAALLCISWAHAADIELKRAHSWPSISALTVEAHRRNIEKKLGLRSTPALIRFAIDSGLGKNDS